MEKIDKEAYLARLNRITEMFSGMVQQAGEMSKHRCPYRDRHDRCTASFRCRNQRPPEAAGQPEQCGHDGTFDYRSAWDSDPDALPRAKSKVERVRTEAAQKRNGKSE